MAPPGVAGVTPEFCVQSFESLKPRRPDGEAAAMELLKRAAWQVQPIMKRRRWRIGVLRELEPENMTRGALRSAVALSRGASCMRCGAH